MSHYAVATMKKMKADNLPGILRHDFRETDHHKNQDIDVDRSSQNYDLVADRKIRKNDVMNYIAEHRIGKRAVRKDAVVLDEWIISSDQGFFADMSSEAVRGYFKTAVSYFGDLVGNDRIMYASVHVDESTPHMHMGIVPMTKDGKLSSKQVFDRNTLRKIQSEFPKYMQEHGYKVVRGSEKSQRKKLSVDEFKHAKEAEKQVKQSMIDMGVDLAPDKFQYKDKILKDNPEAQHELMHDFSLQKIIQAIMQAFRKFEERLKTREKAVAKRERELEQREKALQPSYREKMYKSALQLVLAANNDRDNWHNLQKYFVQEKAINAIDPDTAFKMGASEYKNYHRSSDIPLNLDDADISQKWHAVNQPKHEPEIRQFKRPKGRER